MRYFIRLSFDGAKFHGWQLQKNANSIQAELNKALFTVLKKNEIETIGCGRTDTGVHAKKFFAHFEHEPIESFRGLIHQLNSILPHPIVVHSIFPVGERDHARFSATSRTYLYRLYRSKDPFLRERAYFFPFDPDIERMNFFAKLLLEQNDFSSFSKSNTQTLTNICLINFAEWKCVGDELIFTITADRFLRNMVRAIVGTLLNAGLDKMDEKEFAYIMKSRSRSEAGASVPAHGLYLSDVTYPFPVF